jgi:UDP-N-acetylmuramate dehydrogenase
VIVENVGLAPYCTLGVGGPARFFVEARDVATVLEAVDWAQERGVPLRILGGGSNLLVADEGVPGLVLKLAERGISWNETHGHVELVAAAGEPWDEVVALAVARGWAGLECLSGIPGLVGATPIQNVGAYGQEVSERVASVRAFDRRERAVVRLTPDQCGFRYRDSLFKSEDPERYIILGVTYRLTPGGLPTVRYAELVRYLESRGLLEAPSLADVREAVIAIRRSKSMVIDPGDPNRRSCGSFFVNPVVPAEVAARVRERAGSDPAMPRWLEADGRVKLSAAWLIERAGFARGHTEGPVGLSTRHALAIVGHDGARARDIVSFARRVRARVEERFGVRLVPEPVFWGIPGWDE